MALQNLDFTPKPVTPDRMRDCIDTLLSMQNPNGGYCSYELQRGSEKMEWLNAAEVFGEIGQLQSWMTADVRREYHGRLFVSRVHDLCVVSHEILLESRSNLSHGGSFVSFKGR